MLTGQSYFKSGHLCGSGRWPSPLCQARSSQYHRYQALKQWWKDGKRTHHGTPAFSSASYSFTSWTLQSLSETGIAPAPICHGEWTRFGPRLTALSLQMPVLSGVGLLGACSRSPFSTHPGKAYVPNPSHYKVLSLSSCLWFCDFSVLSMNLSSVFKIHVQFLPGYSVGFPN